ncbi:Vomp family autotransporter [Bartonella koehlerae]|nr:Vomp family autotransporter [Bartonella koehlerae]
MKKLYSTQNWAKAVSLGTAMAALLSSVSPIFAANLAIRGGNIESTSGTGVTYQYGSHGSIVFAGDDDYCGVDNVVGRGGKQQEITTNRITAEEQYNRFINGYNANNGGNPYGMITQKVTWSSDGVLTNNGSYMGTATEGIQSALPEAYGVYSFATGCGASATGNYSTAFGAGATTKAGGAQAFGVSALAGGKASVAMGVGSEASGESTVAIGGVAQASGLNAVALGARTKASESYTIAIGSQAEARASGAIAIGGSEPVEEDDEQDRFVIAYEKDAIAIGSNANAEKMYSIAIGSNAQVRVKDGVAIGGGSISLTDKGVFGYDPATNKSSTDNSITWRSTAGAFSVGEVGGEDGKGVLTRQITGVAAGTEDTDAVNVAQLKAMRSVAAGAWKLAVNDEETTNVEPGNTVKFIGINAEDDNEESKNVKITKGDENEVRFDLNDIIRVKRVIAGKANVSDNGFVITGGPNMTTGGINAGNKQVKGVAKGSYENDAVNVAQLNEVKGLISKAEAWNLSVNDGDSTDVNPGTTVDFSVENSNLNIEKDNESDKHTIKFALNDILNLTSVATGRSVMSDDGFGFTGNNGPRIAFDGIDAGNQKITGVANATEDDEAVNYKQLKAVEKATKTNWQLSVNAGNAMAIGPNTLVNLEAVANEGSENIKIEQGEDHNVRFDLANNITVTSVIAGRSVISDDGFGFTGNNRPRIAFDGIDAGNQKITKVLEGTDNTDAVNLKQLNEVKGLISAVGAWKLAVNDEEATNVEPGNTVKFIGINAEDDNEESKNVKITKGDENEVRFDLNDIIRVKRVIAGKANVSDNGFVITGGPNMTTGGISAGNKQIKGVAKGSHENDAVNVAQLNEVKDQVAGNNLVKWVEDGKLITIGQEKDGTKIDITGSEGERTIAGVKAAINDNEAVNKKQLDDTITEATDSIKLNILVKQDEEDTPITVGKERGGTTINVANKLGGARTISGIKAAVNSDEAVNKEQLDGQISDITDIINNIKIDTAFAVLYDKNDDDTVNYNSVTLGGGKSEGSVALRNIKNGDISEQSHDAINGSQIYEISENVAEFFGGNAAFKSGAFVGPQYNLSFVSADGSVKQEVFNNVGSALTGLDANVKNVNSRLTYVANDFNQKFNQFSQDALLWSENERAFVALHGPKDGKTDSKITYLLNGDITEDSTDAVNGSQLFKVVQNTSKYFGGSTDVIYDIEPAFLIKDKIYHNVTDAFTGVNISINNIDNKISDLKKNNLVQQEEISNVITIGAKTVGTEINIAGYASVARKISGVKAAENGDEAVNKAQLDKSIEEISKDIETASAAAVLYDKNEDGIINYDSVTFGGNKNNGPVALLNVKDGDISKGSADAITGNQLYIMSNQLAAYFGDAKYENGKWTAPSFKIVQVDANGRIIKNNYNTVAEAFGGINSGMLNIHNRIDDVINKVDSDVLKWNKDKNAYDANHDRKPSKIINVADGKIVEGSKDAVNGGQLWKTNERITGVEKDVKHISNRVDNISNTIADIGDIVINIDDKVNNIAEDAVRYDRDENGKKTNKINLKGGNESEPVMIDNVADGRIETNSKEAINGGQLHDYTKEQMKIVLDQSKHYTDQRVNNIVVDAIDDAVERANNYTNMKFEVLNYSIENVRKEAKQAAAIGLAVSSLRYNDTPGKLSAGFGSGLWRSQSAFAFGASYTSESGSIRSNVSVTTSGGHWGIGAGLNMTLN